MRNKRIKRGFNGVSKGVISPGRKGGKGRRVSCPPRIEAVPEPELEIESDESELESEEEAELSIWAQIKAARAHRVEQRAKIGDRNRSHLSYVAF